MVETVFAIIELVGVGIEYAERIAILMDANDEELAAVKAHAEKRRKAALAAMIEQE